MKHLLFILTILVFSSCYDESEFGPSRLNEVLKIKVSNDYQLADNFNTATLRAELPFDLNTDTDNMVEFIILGTKQISEKRDIRLITENGSDKKISEFDIISNKAESIKLRCKLNLNGSEITRDTVVNFIRSYPESIRITTDALTIKPDSTFSEIEISTKGMKSKGLVSLKTVIETKALDSLGTEIGIFTNYQNSTDSLGIITNKYTLGLSPYQGEIRIISYSIDNDEQSTSDTLSIISKI